MPLSPEEIKKFVDNYVDSFVCWDLILFYHGNPGARDDVKGLASRLGRKEKDIERGVKSLCEKKILREADADTFEYAPLPEIAEQIGQFTTILESTDLRLLALLHVLDKEGRGRWKKE